jgi:flavin-dependent dehydrogenase
MQPCDVVIIGGGPAGASCARALGLAGADVLLLDRDHFPRQKPCAGWVTPAVLRTIGITPAEYAGEGRTLQPFTAFRTSVMANLKVRPTAALANLKVRPTAATANPEVRPASAAHVNTTAFAEPVSYGILRPEFDTFLLRRVTTPVLEGQPLTALRRTGGDWIVNERWRAPVVVGAGGHFCPVARLLRASARSPAGAVLTRCVERRLDSECGISGTMPELYFCADLEGYGWCIRKGDVLNVGIGRRTGAGFRAHVMNFAARLARDGRVPPAALDWHHWRGHAYTLAGDGGEVAGDGVLLIGDAAGLAARESGEGIGPAIESGLAAAGAIIAAHGGRHQDDLQSYAGWVAAHRPRDGVAAAIRKAAPAAMGRALLRSPAFARHVIEQFFLKAG